MQFQRDPVVTDDVLLHSAYIHTGCVILFIFVVLKKRKKEKQIWRQKCIQNMKVCFAIKIFVVCTWYENEKRCQ